MGTRSTLRGEDGVLVALPSLCFPFAPAVSKRSFSLWWWLLCFVCVHLSSSESAAPRFVPSSPPPLSGCVCAFLTDCAIFVCLYLSLTRTTKQWYAHLFFLGSVSSLAPSLPAVEGSCEQLWCCHIHGAGSCPVASLPHG